MKIVKKEQAKKFQSRGTCSGVEYHLNDKDIDGAVVNVNGRYPDKGSVVNLKCKELAYVLKGEGKLFVEGSEVLLKEGDLVLIEPGEKFYWDGNLTMFVPCVPAWYQKQHKEVE